MTVRIYHGDIQPAIIAKELAAYFDRGNYRVQSYGEGDSITVQIATRKNISSGGQTALTVKLDKVADGISIDLSEQAWLGVIASLGVTAFNAFFHPLSLLDRIDDIAQDVESSQLRETVWKVVEATLSQKKVGLALSEALSSKPCPWCHTANPVASPHCLACGAPLGQHQPHACLQCGFVLRDEAFCPNCGTKA